MYLDMACSYNEYELYIIWKICRRNRWCDKHISRQDLVRGRPSDQIGKYKDAIDRLISKGVLKSYHAQSREDVCMPKCHRNTVLEILKTHESEYSFIAYLEFIR